MNPWKIRRWIFIATLAYVVLLLTATHLPPREVPNTHVNDKIEHLTAYFLLCGLLQLCVWTFRRSLLWVFTVWFCVLAFGAVDELSQPPFGRTCDIHDWYADATGSAVASVLAASALAFTRGSLGLADSSAS